MLDLYRILILPIMYCTDPDDPLPGILREGEIGFYRDPRDAETRKNIRKSLYSIPERVEE